MSKSCFSIGIQMLCIAFVVWQTFECIDKYIESPQGTETHVDFTGQVPFPSITVCKKEEQLNSTILKRCGFSE